MSLFGAIEQGDESKVQRHLIFQGADIGGHRGVAELLLKKGAKVDAAPETGITPLMMAAKAKDLSMVKLLLANKADPNKKNTFGASAIDLAQEDKDPSILAAFKDR
ncbi:ankyrin repeat domain-containing protein [bacterium]|nr:MAG: ankyrin repeat domain-containing protein [bacterium]